MPFVQVAGTISVDWVAGLQASHPSLPLSGGRHYQRQLGCGAAGLTPVPPLRQHRAEWRAGRASADVVRGDQFGEGGLG